jgi:enterochelin esterase family protein
MSVMGACLTILLSSWNALAAQPEKKEPSPRRPAGVLVSPEILPDGKITFRLRAPKAEKVSVICEAIGTKPMTKDENGVWSLTVGPVAPGIYDCQFDIDGLRITDPASPNVFGNRQGSRGFVEVPGPQGHPRSDQWRDVPHGTVTVHWYTSKATNSRRRVHVYAPPDYARDTSKHYPVLYLLHGSGDNDSHWTQLGRANVIADNLLADERIVPMIIVMPDGHVGDRSRAREAEGRNRGQDAFEKDLMESVLPLVEANYRVLADPQHRGIVGLSMGGGQSISVGLGHLDQFAWVGAFSAAVSGNSPVLTALGSNPDAANQKLKLLWIAIGKDDFLVARNRDFTKALDEIKIRHSYHESAGTHAWGVWRGYLAEFLPLIFR